MEYLIVLGVVATMALYTLIIARCLKAPECSNVWLVNPTISRQAALPVRLLDERCARKSLGDHPKTRLKLRLTASAI